MLNITKQSTVQMSKINGYNKSNAQATVLSSHWVCTTHPSSTC